MKRALVLSGGGALGAYQMGAWKALRELGVEFQLVTGTSVGALNAAFVAQDDYERADILWRTITQDQVVSSEIRFEFSLESLVAQRSNLIPFLAQYARNGGADVTPLKALIRSRLDEKKLRASPIDYGLVTVQFPSLTTYELMIKEIPMGQIEDYIMASTACFPAFPMVKIDGKSYIDGGYGDNLPVNLAIRNGAEEVVCVDLHFEPEHPHLISRPWVTYIYPSRPFPSGSFLSFERESLERNRLLGYRDTLRAYGRIWGVQYSIQPMHLEAYQTLARRFSLAVARMEGEISDTGTRGGRKNGVDLTELLIPSHRNPMSPTYMRDFIMGAEYCADRLGIDANVLYTFDSLNRAILAAIPYEEGRELAEQIENGNYLETTGVLPRSERDRRIACIMALMEKDLLHDRILRAVSLFEEDLFCALYGYSIRAV